MIAAKSRIASFTLARRLSNDIDQLVYDFVHVAASYHI